MPRRVADLVAALIAVLMLVSSGWVAYNTFDIVVALSVLIIEACLGLLLTEVLGRFKRSGQKV